MLVLEIKFCLGRLLRSNYSIISGPTGQDARGGDPNASSLKNSSLGRLLRSNYSIISGPTGHNARGGNPNASSLKNSSLGRQ